MGAGCLYRTLHKGALGILKKDIQAGASGQGEPLLFQIHSFSSCCVAQLHVVQWKAGRKGEEGHWTPEVMDRPVGGARAGLEVAGINPDFRKIRAKVRDGRTYQDPLLKVRGEGRKDPPQPDLRLQDLRQQGGTHPLTPNSALTDCQVGDTAQK